MAFYRYPHTRQEAAYHATESACKAFYGRIPLCQIRAKRNPSNLPDAWDDKAPGITRSWKKHRRNQWK